MKKLNLLLPLTTVCFTPIIAFTSSCGNDDGMRTVSIKSLLEHSFKRNTDVIPISEEKKVTEEEAVIEYLNDVKTNSDILIDDICDSISLYYTSQIMASDCLGSLSFEVYDTNNDSVSIYLCANDIKFNYYDPSILEAGRIQIDGSAKIDGIPLLFGYDKSWQEEKFKWLFKFDFETIIDKEYDLPWNINASIQASQTSDGITKQANINGEFNNKSDEQTLQILKNFMGTFLGNYITCDLFAIYFMNVQLEQDPQN